MCGAKPLCCEEGYSVGRNVSGRWHLVMASISEGDGFDKEGDNVRLAKFIVDFFTFRLPCLEKKNLILVLLGVSSA